MQVFLPDSLFKDFFSILLFAQFSLILNKNKFLKTYCNQIPLVSFFK